MPINLSGEVAANLTVVPNVTVATPSYAILVAALLGAIAGGSITFIITYAKTRAEMKWELKREAYKSILDDVDQAVTKEGREIREAKTNKRRAKHLIRIAFGQSDITDIANKIIDRTEGMSLAELQDIIDDELMPKVESDLEKTIKDWWKIWE
jgi:hypothetical protein